MKPVQLLGLAFLAAAFAFVVTLISMGFFQQRYPAQSSHALQVAAIVGGITFITTLLIIALLILAVDPAQVAKPIERPVLLPPEDETATDASSATTAQAQAAPKPAEGEEPPAS
jgi:hypothetical protein